MEATQDKKWCNERMRGLCNERQHNNQLAQDDKRVAQGEDDKRAARGDATSQQPTGMVGSKPSSPLNACNRCGHD